MIDHRKLDMLSPNFLRRRKRLRKGLKLNQHSVFLITNLTNVYYLTGFTGSAGWLLMTDRHDLLLSDSRYATQIQEECPDLECDIRRADETLLLALTRVIKSLKSNTVYYEPESITKAAFDQLQASLQGLEFVVTDLPVESLRAVKDTAEIASLRQSIKINQQTFRAICSQLRADQTELEIAHQIEHQMRLFGASGVSFAPAVAVGQRAALPHAKPGNKHISDDSFFLIDWGTKFRGYASDLTRIVVTAKIPPKLRKIYEIVLAAQQAAIDAIAPGQSLQAVDQAARKVIDQAGFGKQFGHGTGHGLGLEIHEKPFLSPIAEGTLTPGMVITIEPGIYLPGWGGVRIEDDVLVTEEGRELLSDLPRQLDDWVVDLF